MPSKNELKQYLKNGYYHIYNRGVDKRIIYKDEQDYGVFLNFLKYYLSSLPKLNPLRKITIRESKTYQISDYKCKNYHQAVTLLAYCLMPNHFHLLIKQTESRNIESFMKSIGTRYSMYFNKRYQRSGHLFQGRYNAVLVDSDEQLIHLSRYIHLNPSPNLFKQASSYPDYLNQKNTPWLQKQDVTQHFKNSLAYKKFVQTPDQSALSILSKLTLDS